MDLQEALEYLGMSSENISVQEVRKRYSALLKTTHPEENPEQFMALSEAYQIVLEAAKIGIIVHEKPQEQLIPRRLDAVSCWIEKVYQLYEDLDRRKDIDCWKEVLQDDVCISAKTYLKAGEALREFLKYHSYIPYSLMPLIERMAGVLLEGGLRFAELDSGLIMRNYVENKKPDFGADDYIREYQRISAAYQNVFLYDVCHFPEHTGKTEEARFAQQAYLHDLEEMAAKGFVSAYDLRDRIELCILLGIDGSSLVQQLLDVCVEFHKMHRETQEKGMEASEEKPQAEDMEASEEKPQVEDILLWQEEYGRIADLFYKEEYQKALAQIDATSDAAQIGIAEKENTAGCSLYHLRRLIYEKQGRRLWQEFETAETIEAAKKAAIKEHREDAYYILCTDYYYMNRNYSECRKIAESLDALWGKQKKTQTKRYSHNLYLIAQCALALSDYETAELYADMLLEEGENIPSVFALHMKVAFFLNKGYEALQDYEIIAGIEHQVYQDSSLAFMAALLYMIQAVDAEADVAFNFSEYQDEDAAELSAPGAYIENTNFLYMIYERVRQFLETVKANPHIQVITEKFLAILEGEEYPKPQELAFQMLCSFLGMEEDTERRIAATAQEDLGHWNPLLLYLYAMKNTSMGKKKDILQYLYERYGVYGEAGLFLSMWQQHLYFEVNFKKSAKRKALDYMSVQVNDGYNGYDRIALARLLFHLKQEEDAYAVLMQIPDNYRKPEVWHMIFQLSVRTWGMNNKKAFENAAAHGCDTADVWYEYINAILFQHGVPVPFEENLMEAADYITRAVEKFPEAEWKFLLLQSDIHIWQKEVDGAAACISRALELAKAEDVPFWRDDSVNQWKPLVELHWNLLMIYRRLVYVNWISKNTAKAWELAAEVEAQIVQYFGEAHSIKKLRLLADWWVYVTRIMMNHNLYKAEAYLKERMDTFAMEKQVLTSPILARAGLELYKKRIMLVYLNDEVLEKDKKHTLSELAEAFMKCFHLAYPEGNLEDYMQVEEELQKRMDQAGWYYMAVGNEYMAEQCFRKQISQPLCAQCRGMCYKGYLNISRMLKRNGKERLAKDYYKNIHLPDVCKLKLLR